MTSRLLLLAAPACLLSAPALAQGNDRFQPIQSNDALYTCEQLLTEAAVMEDTLGINGNGFNDLAAANAALSIGTDLAVRAGGAGAARVLGGLGGLGGLARGAIEQQQQADEERKKLAQGRWYYLAGLYIGKACDQPPAPPAVAEVAAPGDAQTIPAVAEIPAPEAGPQLVPAEAPAAGPALPAADAPQ